MNSWAIVFQRGWICICIMQQIRHWTHLQSRFFRAYTDFWPRGWASASSQQSIDSWSHQISIHLTPDALCLSSLPYCNVLLFLLSLVWSHHCSLFSCDPCFSSCDPLSFSLSPLPGSSGWIWLCPNHKLLHEKSLLLLALEMFLWGMYLPRRN